MAVHGLNVRLNATNFFLMSNAELFRRTILLPHVTELVWDPDSGSASVCDTTLNPKLAEGKSLNIVVHGGGNKNWYD